MRWAKKLESWVHSSKRTNTIRINQNRFEKKAGADSGRTGKSKVKKTTIPDDMKYTTKEQWNTSRPYSKERWMKKKKTYFQHLFFDCSRTPSAFSWRSLNKRWSRSSPHCWIIRAENAHLFTITDEVYQLKLRSTFAWELSATFLVQGQSTTCTALENRVQHAVCIASTIIQTTFFTVVSWILTDAGFLWHLRDIYV